MKTPQTVPTLTPDTLCDLLMGYGPAPETVTLEGDTGNPGPLRLMVHPAPVDGFTSYTFVPRSGSPTAYMFRFFVSEDGDPITGDTLESFSELLHPSTWITPVGSVVIASRQGVSHRILEDLVSSALKLV